MTGNLGPDREQTAKGARSARMTRSSTLTVGIAVAAVAATFSAFGPATGQVEEILASGRAVVVGSTAGGRQAACMQCHGTDGAGDAVALFPRLAGQLPAYMVKALRDYAEGRRPNEIMSPIAQALTDDQQKAVSIYYASQSAPPSDLQAEFSSPERIERRGVLSAIGDSDIGVQACQNCHGPNGSGLAPIYPVLAGQHASYLKQTLTAWKSGERGGDPQDIMRHIARKLSDADIEAVAVYFATLPPPRPLAFVDAAQWTASTIGASGDGVSTGSGQR